MIWMQITLTKIVSQLAEARAKLDQSMKGNPFEGLAEVMANSVGLGWGWVLLFGGALGVIVLALVAPRTMGDHKISPSRKSNPVDGTAFSKADAIIADLVAKQRSPKTSMPGADASTNVWKVSYRHAPR